MDMQLRRRETDVQSSSNFLVAEPRRDQLGGLPFAPGERDRRRRRVAADDETLGGGDPAEQLRGHPARAVLLATMNIHDEAHEIGRSGGVRDITDHTRPRPGDNILFRLPHHVRDDADVRFDLAGSPGRGSTVPELRVHQHHICLQGRAQRRHLRQIGAQPDYRDQRIAFKELGEDLAAETHFGDDYDAQTPRFGGAQARLARRRVRGKFVTSIAARFQPSLAHVSPLLFGPCSNPYASPQSAPTHEANPQPETCLIRPPGCRTWPGVKLLYLTHQDCLAFLMKANLADRCAPSEISACIGHLVSASPSVWLPPYQ